jgi:peptide/nickel transport system permease protein
MKWTRPLAITFLSIIAAVCVTGAFVAPPYAKQFRDEPNATTSRQHFLGTDDLGRDRFARLVYGTGVSLLLAPSAALLSCLLAAVIGSAGGFWGGWLARMVVTCTDLFLSMPWLFLLITVRALLPLNCPPAISVIVTFGLLGCLGWAASARVICAETRNLCNADFVVQARASGSTGWRVLWHQIIPNLRPILLAQFWISVPGFILAEANLGILGLGVTEPLPSWGSLLRDLESYSAFSGQLVQFVPLILFVAVVSAFHIVLTEEELPA